MRSGARSTASTRSTVASWVEPVFRKKTPAAAGGHPCRGQPRLFFRLVLVPGQGVKALAQPFLARHADAFGEPRPDCGRHHAIALGRPDLVESGRLLIIGCQ